MKEIYVKEILFALMVLLAIGVMVHLLILNDRPLQDLNLTAKIPEIQSMELAEQQYELPQPLVDLIQNEGSQLKLHSNLPGWTIKLSHSLDSSKLKATRNQIRKAGYPAYINQGETKDEKVLFVGPHTKKEDAMNALMNLETKFHLQGEVIPYMFNEKKDSAQ
ncbi:MAG: SPOR domain-containing protein [Candidatus Berkiellales bacterium]